MSKKTYIQSKNFPYELIEITNDQQPALPVDGGALWGDRSYDGMRTTDGTDISSRTKHREYMKANNLTTADDFTQSWAKAKAQRESYMQQGGSYRRQDIERAINKLKG